MEHDFLSVLSYPRFLNASPVPIVFYYRDGLFYCNFAFCVFAVFGLGVSIVIVIGYRKTPLRTPLCRGDYLQKDRVNERAFESFSV